MGKQSLICCFLVLFVSCKQVNKNVVVTELKKEITKNLETKDEFRKIARVINSFSFMHIEKKGDSIFFNHQLMAYKSFRKTQQENGLYILESIANSKIEMYPSISSEFNSFDVKFPSINITQEDIDLKATLRKFKFIYSSPYDYDGEISFVETTYCYNEFEIKIRFEKMDSSSPLDLWRISINETEPCNKLKISVEKA